MIIGKKVIHYQTIDSTNEEARRLIGQGAGEGIVLVAEKQTKGKGKPGSAWFSPEGNLYFSAVVKPRRNPKELSPITLLGALAARSAINKIARLAVVIKWPNDILINGKKAGGVLVERVPSGHLIIGIGINLNSDKESFPGEIKDISTSLKVETGKHYDIESFAKSLIFELDLEYLAYLSKV